MDSEEDIDKNILSEVVSDILKCHGYSMDNVKVLRSVCLLSEKILYDFFGLNQTKSGSLIAEGSWVSGSDTDRMYVTPGILAVNRNCNYSSRKMHIFTMAHDECSSGYTKLQVHKLNQDRLLSSDIQSMRVKDGNILFLSNEEFLNTLKNGIINNLESPYGNASFYLHGPCLVVPVCDLKGISATLECDISFGIQCHSRPAADCEWKDRPRSKGWPSKTIVDIITSFPVHLMPIGDNKSKISLMQWRFSFSQAERELIWNFNDIQFQCYVLMKSIFRGKLQPFSPDELSTYQIKNLLFWISEENGVKMFTQQKLLHCLEICFKRFKQHILKGFLSHYILRDRNLLAGKLDTQTRQQIADEIDKNLEDIFVTIFECRHILPSDNFSKMYNGSKRNFVCQVRAPLNDRLMKCLNSVKFHIIFQCTCNNLCLEMMLRPNTKEKLLTFIKDINSGKNRSNTVLPFMVKATSRFGFIQLGIMLTDASYKIDKTPEEIDCYSWVTHVSFKVGFDLDELSGKLYSATFALLDNKIDTTSEIMSLIMCNTKPFIFSVWCLKSNTIRIIHLSNSEICDIEYDDVNDEILYSCDMI